MPPFPKLSYEYDYNVQAQINALREYEATKPGRDGVGRPARGAADARDAENAL